MTSVEIIEQKLKKLFRSSMIIQAIHNRKLPY